MAGALSRQMSGQIAGDPAAILVMSRKPPAASLSKRRVGVGGFGGEPHEGGGGQVRHVGDDRHEVVVAVGRECHQVGTQAGYDGLDRRKGPRVGRGRRREDPGRHRRTAPGRHHRGPPAPIPPSGARRQSAGGEISETIGPFTPPTSVTTRLAGLVHGEQGVDLGGDRRHRGGHERDGGEVVHAELVDRPELPSAPCPGLIEIAPGDMPSLRPQGERDRGPHEPEAGHLRTARTVAVAPRRPASVGEVIAKPAGTFEIDMVELFSCALGVKVQQNPDTARHGALDGELARTDERHVAEPERACRGGGEHRGDVLRSR